MIAQTRPPGIRSLALPLAALVLAALTAGCGAAAPAPGTAGSAGPSTSAGPTSETAAPVELPWPAPGASDVAALQDGADRGSQPWLLDPAEVALAYVAAAHGWTGAEAFPTDGGTTVDVHDADGGQARLTLRQPGRAGTGGIWVVTAETRP